MNLILLTMLVACAAPPDADQVVTVTEARKDANGFLVHEVQSPYQTGKTQMRVLLPERLEQGKRYPVVFVLPVEARTESRYGDGLLEVKRHDLPNQFQAVFVSPTFSHLPWYADHPDNREIRQELYLLRVVVPFVDRHYSVQDASPGRLLLGFSKSGWGAICLLLRHPEVFGKAASWDAPLMLAQPNRFGMGDIFGTQANFEQYQITRLLEQRAGAFQQGKRLMLVGHANFRDHHEQAHALMTKLGIDHEYRDGPAHKHDWHSGWVREGVAWLLSQRSSMR